MKQFQVDAFSLTQAMYKLICINIGIGLRSGEVVLQYLCTLMYKFISTRMYDPIKPIRIHPLL